MKKWSLKIHISVSLVLAVLLIAADGLAATYYVDPVGGNDSAAGTEAAPWKNPPWSVGATGNSDAYEASFQTGDIVLIKRGTLLESSKLTFSSVAGGASKITFGAYGAGADPIISAREYVSSGWTAAGSEWYIGSITTAPASVFDGTTALALGSAVGALTAGQWFYDADADRVYVRLASDIEPNGRDINYASIDRCAYFASSSNIVIEDIVFEAGINSTAPGFYFSSGTGIILNDVTIQKTLTYALRTTGTNSITASNLSCLYPIGATSLYFVGADTIVLSGGNFNGITDATGVKNITISGATITGNVSSSSPTSTVIYDGITIAGKISLIGTGGTNTVRNSRITAPDEYILRINGGAATVYNNTITGTGANNIAITADILCDSGASITHNKVYDSMIGISSKSDAVLIQWNEISDAWNGLSYVAGGGAEAILIDSGDGTRVLNNHIKQGCYQGIVSSTAEGVLIAFNVIDRPLVNSIGVNSVDPYIARVYHNTTIHSPDPDVIENNGHAMMVRTGAETKKVEIKNNIIVLLATMTGQDGVQIDDVEDLVDLDANVYWEDATLANGQLLYRNGTVYDADFAGWETATGDSGSAITIPGVNLSTGKLSKKTHAKGGGVAVFVNGDGDQYTMSGKKVWDDATDSYVGVWAEDIDIGAYEYRGGWPLQFYAR